jgi:hypothetical protein
VGGRADNRGGAARHSTRKLEPRQKEWAAEDKQTAVAEALLRQELGQQTKLATDAQARVTSLETDAVSWSMAVGRRDGELKTTVTRLQGLDEEARADKEKRQKRWEENKGKGKGKGKGDGEDKDKRPRLEHWL